jgi:hypothetical protein
MVDGGREIFAITDANYPDVYANSVLRRIASNADPDAKSEWTYDANTTRVNFKELMRQEISPSDYKHSADDVFQIGRSWSMRDDGSTSVKMNLLTFRQLCANMLILAADSYLKHVRHRGEDHKILGRIDKLFDQTAGFSEMFSRKWGASRLIKWNENPTLDAAIAAYGLLINKRHIPVTGDRDLFAATLGTKWLEEPGDTVADLVNGVTRYARNASISNSSRFGASELEKSAGKLLMLPAKTWEATRRV